MRYTTEHSEVIGKRMCRFNEAGCLITPAGGNRASNGRSAASSSTAGKKRKLTEAEADGTNEEGNAKPKKKTVKLSDGAKARMDEMDRDRRKLRLHLRLVAASGLK